MILNDWSKGKALPKGKAKFKYLGDCTQLNGDKVNEMIDHPKQKQVTWKTFIKHIPIDDIRYLLPDYDYHGQGLHIKDDWHVSFHKSYWGEKIPCYYIRHSSIELVWIPENTLIID